jgi:putative effector of murein hydrolase LrgA (UPF0299 family)
VNYPHQLIKMAALAATVALIAVAFLPPLTAATIGTAVLWLLLAFAG